MHEQFAGEMAEYYRDTIAAGLSEYDAILAFDKSLEIKLQELRHAAYLAIGYGEDDDDDEN